MTLDVVAIVTAASAVVGFLSMWIKMGVEKGEHRKLTETLEHKILEHEKEIADIKNTTHSIQLDIAKSIGKIEVKLDTMGKIESKLDTISETVATLRGGRRAQEK